MATLVLVSSFSLDSMTPSLKNQLIAPKISEFNSPKIPDITSRRKYLLQAYIHNYHLSLAISNSMRRLIFNFIRKTENAFEEYCEVLSDLGKYSNAKDRNVVFFFSALRHLEHCLAHLNEATECINQVGKQLDLERQWERDDGSVLQRINTLHNFVKHFDRKIVKKESFEKETSFKLFAARSDGSTNFNYTAADVANTPFWLTDEGLESKDASLTFLELADEILSFYQQAEDLATMKPPLRKSGSMVNTVADSE